MNIIASIFGDDEHTAHDDAYTRAMKCRKWVVSAAVVYWIVSAAAFTPVKFGLMIANMRVSAEVWQTSAGVGLAYITLQYGLLLAQLAFRYRHLLRARFAVKRTAEIEEAIKALEKHEEDASSISRTAPSYRARTEELRLRIDHLYRAQRTHPAVMAIEVLIDGLRLLSPFVAVAVALATSH